MHKTIFKPLGGSKEKRAPVEKQWYIHVQQEYDAEKAKFIKLFMCKYLDCWSYDEEINGQAN